MDQHSQKGLFPVLNGTTIGGNRTIAELKAQSAMEEARRQNEERYNPIKPNDYYDFSDNTFCLR